MTDGPDLHADIRGALEDIAQRYTTGRKRLVEVLDEADRPLTIADIVGRAPSLPQSSVYRNLTVLEEAGAVRRLSGADEFARYELAEQHTGHHHHLVCTSCGDVSDHTLPARVEEQLEAAERAVRRATGFRPHAHSLEFVGICADCAG